MTMFSRKQVEENLRAKNKELQEKLEAVRKIAKGLSEDSDEFVANRGKQILKILGESRQSTPKVKTE